MACNRETYEQHVGKNRTSPFISKAKTFYFILKEKGNLYQ